ncbi:MAG: tetratricopeptide repeat protein [Planctomycetota bacterium]|nr:tetratricopeptide repeat protein [Planctomycetota bacterium]
MEVLVVFVVILVAVVVIPLALLTSQRTDAAWREAARRLRLHYHPSGFMKKRRISGRFAGFAVVVDTFTRSSGNSSTTYTRFRVSYPRSLGLGLRLTREGFFTGISKVFGAQDIELGAANFDAAILVKGSRPQAVRRFLTPARRVRVHRLLIGHSGAVVDDDDITWNRVGVLRDAARIVTTVRNFVRVAWHLTGDREDDRALDRALAAGDAGHVQEAVETLQEARRKLGVPFFADRSGPSLARGPPPLPQAVAAAPAGDEVTHEPPPIPGDAGRPGSSAGEVQEEEAPPEPVEERVLEGELLYLAGRHDEAREAFESALQGAPDDPEVRQWLEKIEEEAGAGIPASGTTAAGATGQDADVSLDVESVSAALFDPKLSSLDASRIFDERYAGRTVRWSGKLTKAERFPFDYVFGGEPGTKAIVEVHDTGSTLYGDGKISAVVQLPEGAAEELKELEGQTVRFEGELLRVDGFMRNVYVAGARRLES